MRKPDERGSILIFTLWLATGLAAAALLVGHTSMLHYRQEANVETIISADFATEGALRYVQQVLTTAATAGTLPDLAKYQAEDLTIGNCRVWLLGRSDDNTVADPVYGLTDEAAKLNLNTAPVEQLELLPGMTLELANAIIDWRDPDSDISPYGAESDTYMSMTPAYTAKNAPFETVDELRLLHGATRLLLEGRDLNRNSLLESWERNRVETDRERLTTIPDTGILAQVTTCSREPNTAASGQAKVNLNGPLPAVRQALISVLGNTQGTASAIAARLGTNPVASVLDFCLKAKLSATEAAQVFDRFTTVAGTVVRGRININTAGTAVLACLPGIGTENASKLVAYRLQNTGNLASPLWLASAIGNDAATKAGAFITTRSYQVTADIVAVGPNGRSFRRTRFIFDTSTGTGTPVIVSRRDLTHLGWPLGETLYNTIMNRNRQGVPAT